MFVFIQLNILLRFVSLIIISFINTPKNVVVNMVEKFEKFSMRFNKRWSLNRTFSSRVPNVLRMVWEYLG